MIISKNEKETWYPCKTKLNHRELIRAGITEKMDQCWWCFSSDPGVHPAWLKARLLCLKSETPRCTPAVDKHRMIKSLVSICEVRLRSWLPSLCVKGFPLENSSHRRQEGQGKSGCSQGCTGRSSRNDAGVGLGEKSLLSWERRGRKGRTHRKSRILGEMCISKSAAK